MELSRKNLQLAATACHPCLLPSAVPPAVDQAFSAEMILPPRKGLVGEGSMKKSYSFCVYSADIYIICKHVCGAFVAFRFHRREGVRKNMSKRVSLGGGNNKRLRNTEVKLG